jgi:aminopeptidase N
VDSLTTNLNLILNPNAYQKGAWILHMLRHEMGDSAFFLGLRDYYARYKFRNANSLDFFREMQLHTPKDLTHFRAQWVYREGHPILKEVSQGTEVLVLKQTQQELFSFPLEINFKDPLGNIEQVEVFVKDREVSVLVPQGMRGKQWEYVLDPTVRLLFEVRD